MRSLWFVIPCHGRAQLARVCLTQLRITCDLLRENEIDATAVVIADDENLDTARELGFATIRRDNNFVSRKFNDGVQLACDPKHNPRPADYVVPFGSDDWVDHRILLNLPSPGTVLAFKDAGFVDETGSEIVSRHIDYPAGVGIRVYSRQLMRRCGYRPADEDRKRGCDTSILVNLTHTFAGTGPRIEYGDLHQFQIVDWKSPDQQLNGYRDVVGRFRRGTPAADPFETLANVFPAESLEAMRAVYAGRTAVAA